MSTIPKLWEESVVKEYLTPESHQKSREQFLKTHIDIDKIGAKYLFPHDGNDEFVTQEDFRDAILKSEIEDDNRIFILRGETGSGKSQLCQWLDYQIGSDEDEGDDTHIALHVSRSKTGISDILDIISGPIDTNIDVSNVEDLNPEKVANAIITTLRAFGAGMEQFTEEEIEKLTADRTGNVDLRSILVKNISEYQEAAISDGDKRKTDLITESDYRELSLTAFGATEGGETLFPALQSQVHTILSQNLGVQDFQGKLEELSKEYADRGLRPVLICEDLTTFSVLKEQLLDHIFQLDSGHYDVVLGWTSGWEKDQLSRALGTSQDTDTYMEDRAAGYLSTTDDNGQAYFLDDDVTIELARKYMSVIRSESNTDETIDDNTLAAFNDLYPFNPEFIEQSYNHLIQDGNQRRTPRLLLIRVIRECLSATVPPYKAIEDNPYVEPFPTPLSDLSYSNEVDTLAKWYGSATAQGQIRVQNGVLDTFGVDVSSAERDEDWTYFQADVAPATLSLALADGTLLPDEEITIRATLNNRGEADVAILIDGDQVALSDESGDATLLLPDTAGSICIVGEKDDTRDELELFLPKSEDDNLSVTANPTSAKAGEKVEITARLNGKPENGVTVFRDDEELGRTDDDGKLQFNAPEGSSVEIIAKTDNVEDSVSIDIVGTDITIPVGTNLEPTTVKERLLDYQNWVKSGENYNSSTTLREGVAGVLNEWHDPTLLGNKNATNKGVNGIFYTRGSEIPVSIVGTDERQGPSFDLNFGVEHDDIYRPLFWYGISNDGEFPQEDKYAINYDLLRAWTDELVADFRNTMREDVESCLPESMTIEELIVLSQFLVLNATKGRDKVEADMVFENPPKPNKLDVPGVEEEDQPSSLVESTKQLLRSRTVPYKLAEGFFLLKSNVVDHQRLSDAVKQVDSNLNRYLQQAMMIDASDLPKAYRVSTTRSTSGNTAYPVKEFLERIKNYATELDGLTVSKNAEHIQDTVKKIDSHYDANHERDDLEDVLDRLHNVLDRLEVNKYDNWKKAQTKLEDGSNLNLKQFKRSMQTFDNLSQKSGYELISALHAYDFSRENEVEWEVYEAIAEMIEAAEAKELPEGTGFRKRVSELDELETYEKRRNKLEAKIGGE